MMIRMRWLWVLAVQLLCVVAVLGQERVHIVKSGETLYRIGKAYGVSVEELYQLNPEAKTGIKAGQQLRIPSVQQPKGEPQYHAVQRGETLYSIARQYGTTVDALLRANPQLKNADAISVGMILKVVPSGASSAKGQKVVSTTPSKPSVPSKPLPPPAQPERVMGLKTVVVPAGATIYSLLRSTGWSEEEFYHYNPQAKGGLQAGITILVPDFSLANNLVLSPQVGEHRTVVVALPFSSERAGRRFSDYYGGFLLSLLEYKRAGHNVDLHTLDCADSKLKESIAQIERLGSVDLVIGGVSERSVQELARVASQKGATYVIPFTSKEYNNMGQGKGSVYQVNTPREALYTAAAEKFVEQYKGYEVLFVEHPSDQGDKPDFIATLKRLLDGHRMSHTTIASSKLETAEAVQSLASSYPRAVLVPTSASKLVANNTLTPLAHAVDSLGVAGITAFGYPEWQTYMGSLGRLYRTTSSTFYTTFYVEPSSAEYKQLQQAFLYWYGHGLGSSYPRYSILGYDTGRYFLAQIAGERLEERGIQSSFLFRKHPSGRSYWTNLGVFFVRFRPSREQGKE